MVYKAKAYAPQTIRMTDLFFISILTESPPKVPSLGGKEKQSQKPPKTTHLGWNRKAKLKTHIPQNPAINRIPLNKLLMQNRATLFPPIYSTSQITAPKYHLIHYT
jgi:hypothetical protein